MSADIAGVATSASLPTMTCIWRSVWKQAGSVWDQGGVCGNEGECGNMGGMCEGGGRPGRVHAITSCGCSVWLRAVDGRIPVAFMCDGDWDMGDGKGGKVGRKGVQAEG
eukprot:358619-Chlamydomonas_euryale.AAC.8